MKLNHFVGKVCTISTVAINWHYKPEQMMDYFVGKIDAIDEDGIMMTHSVTNCKNYISFKYIVAIHEEQVLYEDNPDHAKIIEEFRKEKPLTAAKTTINQPSQFVNLNAMAEMAKKAKDKI